jgi:hypothetical protein
MYLRLRDSRVRCHFLFSYVPGYSSQTPDDEKSIRVVVEGYLKAKQWKERLPFVQYASKQEEAILEKYEGREFQLQDPKTQKIQEFPRRPGFFLAKATWNEKRQETDFRRLLCRAQERRRDEDRLASFDRL